MVEKIVKQKGYSLVIDIGNSLMKLFVVDDVRILHWQIFEKISDLEKIFELFPEIRNGIYSASGKIPDKLDEFLSNKLDKLIYFNSETPVPVNNTYNSPETLGSDRLAAAVGANYFFPDTNVIIFDFGTAITIDFVDCKNNFLGGNISPGLSVRFKSLNYFTNRLPLVSIPDKIDEIGKTTNEAIEAGVVFGIIGEIMSYINKYKGHKIIFTGGDSFYFAIKIKIPIFVFRNPVVFGLNRVLYHNL
jgi:type III pantothenate kinase